MIREAWDRLRGREAPPVHRGRARRQVSNRCDLPAPRDPPEDLLRSLREVDPLYDLHYLGNGKWLLGRVVRNSVRSRIAGEIKRRRERQQVRGLFSELAFPELAYQGLGAVAAFHIQGEPDHRIVADAREREWRYLRGADAAFEEKLDHSDGIAEVAGVPTDMGSDEWWGEIEYREHHVRPDLFRARRHFPQGALHT